MSTSRGVHYALDWDYPGDAWLRSRLAESPGELNQSSGPSAETPLLIAARRRRLSAVRILLEAGADVDSRNHGGKTAYAHALRRGFWEVAQVLEAAGASTVLTTSDRLAVALSAREFEKARRLLIDNPGVACTGNSEEDRLLADVAGRNDVAPVQMLIAAGADLSAPGLDGGTPLHNACWFGQPENARLLVEAGAPLDPFDPVHYSSPIGWVAHGSRYSGGAELRQEVYVALAHLLIDAGCSLQYPGLDDSVPAGYDVPQGNYRFRLLQQASPAVGAVIAEAS